jgi:hypothetical protein
LNLKPLALVWLGAWAVVGAVLSATFIGRGSEPAPVFPALGAPSASTDTVVVGGATVRVTSVQANVAETVVTLTVTGRDDLGGRLAYRGPAILTDFLGKQHFERGGSIDGRTLQLRFDGASALVEGPSTLRVGGMGLSMAAGNDPAPATTTFLPGTVALRVIVPAVSDRFERFALNVSVEFAGGMSTLDSLTRDGTVAVVEGHLKGFSAGELQALNLARSVLILEDGSTVPVSGGRSGIGQDLSSFELRFNIAGASRVSALRMELSVPIPPGTDIQPSPSLDKLRTAVGTTATISLVAR